MRSVCTTLLSYLLCLGAENERANKGWGGEIDAFIRDELSKGRYDPAISNICFEMLLELFGRVLSSELGPRAGGEQEIEDVC